MKLKGLFPQIVKLLKASGKGFSDDKVPKLSGSLAYYTIFSMGPLLLIVITMCSFVFGREAAEGRIYDELKSFVGSDTAMQLQQIIKNASLSGKTLVASIIGFVALLIGATSVFAEMQDSINMIWGLKAKPCSLYPAGNELLLALYTARSALIFPMSASRTIPITLCP